MYGFKTQVDKIFSLLLTDAPPHVTGKLDTEGTKEQTALANRFDFLEIIKRCEQMPGYVFTSLTSYRHNFYTSLSMGTGGSVHIITVNAQEIQNGLLRIFNGVLIIIIV